MSILTFDVEEWFHLLDFEATRTEVEWGKYEVRIYENVDRILDILELRKYLTDFQFTDIATAEKLIDWEKVPIVKLLTL